MGEEKSEKEKIGTKSIDTVSQGSKPLIESASDVCETPTPGGPIPIPYPHIATSADTSKGTKTVKINGKETMTKPSSYETSTGDEPSKASEIETLDDASPLKRMMNLKKLGVPIWIWSLIIVIGLVIIWIYSLNVLSPVEPYDAPLN